MNNPGRRYLPEEEPFHLRHRTLELIERHVSASRRKYPENSRMLAAALGEFAELVEAIQTPGLEWEIEQEAADVIAVLVRIIEEGDASTLLPQPSKEGK